MAETGMRMRQLLYDNGVLQHKLKYPNGNYTIHPQILDLSTEITVSQARLFSPCGTVDKVSNSGNAWEMEMSEAYPFVIAVGGSSGTLAIGALLGEACAIGLVHHVGD